MVRRAEGQLAERAKVDYLWRLNHVLLFFETYDLDVINAGAIESYITLRLEQKLGARSINVTVILLGAIPESAVERELNERNRAKGKRVKEPKPSRSYLENAGQIEELLDAAGELDRAATRERQHIERRAMVATLVFAGLRIGELCELRWRDVDLAGGWLSVSESKTDAGRRKVKIRGALRDELLAVRGRHQSTGQDGYVFPTRTGAELSRDNIRTRVIDASVRRANGRLEARGLPPLPARTTPHSLRRTFASVLYALGEDPGVVMDEMGHTDPGLALRIYRQTMRRDEHEKDDLKTLVEGSVLVANGCNEELSGVEAPEQETQP